MNHKRYKTIAEANRRAMGAVFQHEGTDEEAYFAAAGVMLAVANQCEAFLNEDQSFNAVKFIESCGFSEEITQKLVEGIKLAKLEIN